MTVADARSPIYPRFMRRWLLFTSLALIFVSPDAVRAQTERPAYLDPPASAVQLRDSGDFVRALPLFEAAANECMRKAEKTERCFGLWIETSMVATKANDSRAFSYAMAQAKAVMGPIAARREPAALAQGDALMRERRYSEAEAAYRVAISWYRSQTSNMGREIAQLDDKLGEALQAQKRYAEAEVHFRAALGYFNRYPGPESSEALASRRRIALTLSLRGKNRQAEALFAEMLGIVDRKKYIVYPSRLLLMSDLATHYERNGQKERGLNMRRQKLAHIRSTLGPLHRDRISEEMFFGFLLIEHGKLEEARTLLRSASSATRTLVATYPDFDSRADTVLRRGYFAFTGEIRVAWQLARQPSKRR